MKVPAIIPIKPKKDFLDNFSLNTMYEKSTLTTIDNLSIETTMLTSPSCKAL